MEALSSCGILQNDGIVPLFTKGAQMKTRILILTLIIPILYSCAPYQPPKAYTFDKSRAYAKDFDAVWASVVKWFATQGTPIKTMEKASGLIATEYNLRTSTDTSYCDCGTKDYTATIEQPKCNFNVLVERKESSVVVTVTTFFKTVKESYNFSNPNLPLRTPIDCNSKGTLEKELLDYIATN